MLGIESNASEIMPNAEAHEVIASKLLAGQSIACLFIHLPGPGEVLVSDAFVTKVAVGLASGQDIPDQFEQTMGHCDNRLVTVHAFEHLLKACFPYWIGLHCPLRCFHQGPTQFPASFLGDPFAALLGATLFQTWCQSRVACQMFG